MNTRPNQSSRTPDPSHIWENDYVPSGIMLDPKTSELNSYRFTGLDNESNLVFIPDRTVESVNQSLEGFYDNDFLENQFDDELVALSEPNQHACITFAEKHGPLFGAMFLENGICKEPLACGSLHRPY